ncbi:MAG: stage IV sporulation protein A [Thermoanaerobacteraceae bacterium]|nr:stage IV sporulation protein A [Thermoanaerobacteraceae bacterium]
MDYINIYQDIVERTNGDIYIGVVGPVRTGKSTFIKRFMELLVVPNIDNNYRKERTKDELPQSGNGKTITTTEPKFVPNEAVIINLNDNVQMKIRLIDCVGYLVKGALGYLEGEKQRLVMTPWSDKPVPFEQAAEFGTRKVIKDHSTIGLLITADGTITEIPRENYIEAEERVVRELKEINKPFIIILNSTRPQDRETENLRAVLQEKYQSPVIAMDVLNMTTEDINNIIEKLLYEFPVKEVKINLPKWIEALEDNHWIKKGMIDIIKASLFTLNKLKDVKSFVSLFKNLDYVKDVEIQRIDMGSGIADIELLTNSDVYYKVLSEVSGFAINDDSNLISLLKDLSKAKKEYDKIAIALEDAKISGYGVVAPQLDELILDEPEIVKQGNRFGVRLKASAPSLHIIKTDIKTEVSPIIGTERQSEELVKYLLEEFEKDPQKIWNTNIFGKSLHDLVKEGLQNKLYKMPEDVQFKLQQTIQRIVNEGSGGILCIII